MILPGWRRNILMHQWAIERLQVGSVSARFLALRNQADKLLIIVRRVCSHYTGGIDSSPRRSWRCSDGKR